jgi:hypothetical protein
MRLALAVPALLLLVACTRPEVEAFRSNPAPLTVAYSVPSWVPDGPKLEKEYAAALRARLATRVTVVPEGDPGPARPVQVTVIITDLDATRGATPAQVGVATGVAIGALNLIGGNRNGVFDGLFWGLWAGAHASNVQRRDNRYLGYRPRRLSADIRVVQEGIAVPLYEDSIDSREVLEAMDPLRGTERDDEGRIREEEARALARVVTYKLQDHFGWTAKPVPSYYRPEPAAPPEAPKPDGVPAAPKA